MLGGKYTSREAGLPTANARATPFDKEFEYSANEILGQKQKASSAKFLTRKDSKQLPKIYLAGKIRKHCWRHRLIHGLRNHTWDDGPFPQGDFVYIGPFFVGCDHGCFHNENSHGAIAVRGPNLCPGRYENADFDAPHVEVANLCLGTINKADLLFCYLDSDDCYGTLVEIGYALAHCIPVVIVFAPGIATAINNDFWFACAKSSQVIYDVNECELPRVLMNAIRRYT